MRRWTIARYILATALLAGGVALMLKSSRALDYAGAVGLFLLGFSCLGLGVISIALEAARFLAAPFLNWASDVYFPAAKGGKPPLNYNLPWYYEKYGRWEEALAHYEQILRDYPKELPALAGGIRVLGFLNAPGQANAWRERARQLCAPEELEKALGTTAAQLIEESRASLLKRNRLGPRLAKPL